MKDLKQRALRGGLARIISQASTLFLRMGSLVIMARILNPKDFGLVGMATAMVGVFGIFGDFGLTSAAVQHTTITEEQSSTLFWINLLIGATLTLMALAVAPFVAAFYHQQHLTSVTAVLATAFLFNAAAIQHSALLERQMRFVALSMLDIFSLLLSTSIGIGMALRGFGYWSLVVTSTMTPLIFMLGVWLAAGWVPGRPHKCEGITSMMRFGGILSLNGLATYISGNLDKVLLGRFWGAEALGIYGRAYQLVNIPTTNLNSAAGGVVFAALSRLHGNPDRQRSYFLKGYSLVLGVTIFIAFSCEIFAADIIHVFLGSKWDHAIPIFRLLAPTTLGFAILTPINVLLAACGLVEKSLKVSLVTAPILILGYAMGLPWGPNGVASGYSAIMILATVPLMAWAVRETSVSFQDLLQTIDRPLVSGIVAGGTAFGLQILYGRLLHPIPRLAVGVVVISSVYLWMLLYVMKQKFFYLDIIRGLRKTPSTDDPLMVSPNQ